MCIMRAGQICILCLQCVLLPSGVAHAPSSPNASSYRHCCLRVLMQASAAETAQLLCCGKPCHKALPNCPHVCQATCHPGPCPAASGAACQEEVTVRCLCRRHKAKMPCNEVSLCFIHPIMCPPAVPPCTCTPYAPMCCWCNIHSCRGLQLGWMELGCAAHCGDCVQH